MQETDAEQWAAREAWVARHRDGLSIPLWIAVWLVYSIGATVFARAAGMPPVRAAVLPAAGLAFVIGIGFLCGLVQAGLAREHDRRAAWVCWMRGVWILHLPWLAIAVCAVVACVVAAAEASRGGDALSVQLVAGVGFMVWSALTVIGLVSWIAFFVGWSERCFLRRRGIEKLAIVASVILVLGASSLVGVVGGAVATAGAVELFELQDAWDDWEDF